MKALFLGSGTSVGVPQIGCACPVCTSADPRNRRLRASLYVTTARACVLIDTTPDFRQQALLHRLPRVDAIVYTHSHADHILGLDDIRRYNTMQDAAIPAYAAPPCLADLRRVFNYIATTRVEGEYRPRVEFRPIEGPFEIGDLRLEPLAVDHGPTPTLGFRLDDGRGGPLAYVPDCHALPDTALARLGGLDTMILDGLRHRPHATHLTVADSRVLLERIGARRSYMTHMCHDVDHAGAEAALPPSIRLAYDGLQLEC